VNIYIHTLHMFMRQRTRVLAILAMVVASTAGIPAAAYIVRGQIDETANTDDSHDETTDTATREQQYEDSAMMEDEGQHEAAIPEYEDVQREEYEDVQRESAVAGEENIFYTDTDFRLDTELTCGPRPTEGDPQTDYVFWKTCMQEEFGSFCGEERAFCTIQDIADAQGPPAQFPGQPPFGSEGFPHGTPPPFGEFQHSQVGVQGPPPEVFEQYFGNFQPQEGGPQFGPGGGGFDQNLFTQALQQANEFLSFILDQVSGNANAVREVAALMREIAVIDNDPEAVRRIIERAQSIAMEGGFESEGHRGPSPEKMIPALREGLALLRPYTDVSSAEQLVNDIETSCMGDQPDFARCEQIASGMENVMMDATMQGHRAAEERGEAIHLCVRFLTVMQPVIDDPMMFQMGVEFACEMFGKMGWDPRAMGGPPPGMSPDMMQQGYGPPPGMSPDMMQQMMMQGGGYPGGPFDGSY